MERELTAILSADVKGYSRLMGEDEEATIRTLTVYREEMAAIIRQHRLTGKEGFMRFGTYYFLQVPPGTSDIDVIQREFEQMLLSEELGYDTVWLTEHHCTEYGISVSPMALAAAIAARTQRINIALAAAILPFHDPIRLAEEVAFVDILSRGRLRVGIGRGNRPIEFAGYRVPHRPTEVGRWWLPGQRAGDSVKLKRVPGSTVDAFRLHNAIVMPERPDRAYLGYIDGGVVILDITDKAHPQMVGRCSWYPPFTGFTHRVLPLFERGLAVVSEETTRDLAADFPKLIRLLDIREESNPVTIATIPLPDNVNELCSRGDGLARITFTRTCHCPPLPFCATPLWVASLMVGCGCTASRIR